MLVTIAIAIPAFSDVRALSFFANGVEFQSGKGFLHFFKLLFLRSFLFQPWQLLDVGVPPGVGTHGRQWLGVHGLALNFGEGFWGFGFGGMRI